MDRPVLVTRVSARSGVDLCLCMVYVINVAIPLGRGRAHALDLKWPQGMTDRDIAIALGDAAEDAFEEVASLDDRFKAGEATREGETFPTVPR